MSSDYICFNTYMSRLLKAGVDVNEILVKGNEDSSLSAKAKAVRAKGEGYSHELTFFDPATGEDSSNWCLRLSAGSLRLYGVLAPARSASNPRKILLIVGRMIPGRQGGYP